MWLWLTNGGTPSSGGGAEESSGEITLFPPLFLQNKILLVYPYIWWEVESV